jgi:signal transduction histidine kinase
MAIVADETKFKQIMYNLLSNAVKFTPQGGSIGITARRVQRKDEGEKRRSGEAEKRRFAGSPVPAAGNGEVEWLEVAVSDTGIGIRPEDQTRIFNAFEQADGTYARHYEGTGLGLALTKRLVELQGGEIWVQSEVDRGSTFAFVLPMGRETGGTGR